MARKGPAKSVLNGLTLVTLEGELDLSDAPSLSRQLTSHPDAELPDLALDLRQVDFIDCSVIGVIAQAHRQVTEQGGCLRLLGSPLLLKLLRLCNLEGVICIHDSLDLATATRCELRPECR